VLLVVGASSLCTRHVLPVASLQGRFRHGADSGHGGCSGRIITPFNSVNQRRKAVLLYTAQKHSVFYLPVIVWCVCVRCRDGSPAARRVDSPVNSVKWHQSR
jgi:hypothetical protein